MEFQQINRLVPVVESFRQNLRKVEIELGPFRGDGPKLGLVERERFHRPKSFTDKPCFSQSNFTFRTTLRQPRRLVLQPLP